MRDKDRRRRRSPTARRRPFSVCSGHLQGANISENVGSYLFATDRLLQSENFSTSTANAHVMATTVHN